MEERGIKGMADLQKYINDKLQKFIQVYDVEGSLNLYNDKDLKRMWKKDSLKIKNQWQDIKCYMDVKEAVDSYVATVSRFQNIPGVLEDAYMMDIALYKAINAIKKMRQCYDSATFDFEEQSKENIDYLFDQLNFGEKLMQDINMRRLMQD